MYTKNISSKRNTLLPLKKNEREKERKNKRNIKKNRKRKKKRKKRVKIQNKSLSHFLQPLNISQGILRRGDQTRIKCIKPIPFHAILSHGQARTRFSPHDPRRASHDAENARVEGERGQEEGREGGVEREWREERQGENVGWRERKGGLREEGGG